MNTSSIGVLFQSHSLFNFLLAFVLNHRNFSSFLIKYIKKLKIQSTTCKFPNSLNPFVAKLIQISCIENWDIFSVNLNCTPNTNFINKNNSKNHWIQKNKQRTKKICDTHISIMLANEVREVTVLEMNWTNACRTYKCRCVKKFETHLSKETQ